MNEEIREFLHILFKRGRFFIISFLLISVPVIVLALLRPSQYRASAKLLLAGNRSFLQIAPQDSKRVVQVPYKDALNTEVESLKNRSFLITAAHRLQIELVNPVPPDREARARQTAAEIRRGLEVMPFPTSPMIEVAFTYHDKNKAAAVVNTLIDAYLEYHPQLYESPDIVSFYGQRAERLERQLRLAERRLDTFQKRSKIISLQQQKDENVRQLMATDLALKDTVGQIRQTEELITSLEETYKVQPEKVAGDVDMVDNPVARALEERIGVLTVELSDLEQKYTENDRRVQDKREQIAELRSQVAKQPARIVGSERLAMNQIRLNIQEELLRARANLKALQVKRSELEKNVKSFDRRLQDINHKGFRLQNLEDAVASRRVALQGFEKRADEARLSTAMDAAKLGSLRIVDRAFPPSAPYNEKTWLAILIGLFGGLAVGAAGAFGLEFLYQTYHFASDIERELELPVLGLISDIKAA